MSRPENHVVELRIEEVTQLMIQGKKRAEILQLIGKKYKLTTRTIDEYIHRGKEKVRELVNDELEYELGFAVAQLDDLYRQAIKKHNLTECRKIVESRCKLLGLYPAKQLAVNVSRSEDLIHMIEEGEKIREAELAKEEAIKAEAAEAHKRLLVQAGMA